MQSRRTCLLATALGAAYLAAGAAAGLLPFESRAPASLGLIATISMVASASIRTRPRATIAAVVAATSLATSAIYAWRRLLDPTAAIGPVPPSLEPLALGVLGAMNVATGAVVALAFAAGRPASRFRWLVFGATAALLFGFCATVSMRSRGADSRQALLRRVVMLEQDPDRSGWAERQELSTALAILGRGREARAIPLRPDAVGRELFEPPDPPGPPGPDPPFVATPWREAMAGIAAERRLVLIMEAHTVSEHRAWIEQALDPLRAAGFTRYLAEAIEEPGPALTARGYPTSRTGYYTLDPRFGNLVRTALRLGFEVGGYDLAGGDFDRREEYQAAALAGWFGSRPGLKMVVHAGHGHVFKHEVRHVGRYMAARLWEMTGVEPFTIWQSSNELPNDAYRDLIRRIGPIAEPVMLVPPPRRVSETLFPESSVHPAVDAVVVHPPRLGREPTDRRGAFADRMTRAPGVWLGDRWPVVIAAVPDGEPDDAVALDQVMLRPGETDFELWLPDAGCTIRAWGLDGPIRVDADIRSTPVRVRLAP